MEICQICGKLPAVVKVKDEQSGEEKLYCFNCAAKHNIKITPENSIVPDFAAMPGNVADLAKAIEHMFSSMGFDGAAVEIQNGNLEDIDLNELTEKMQELIANGNLPDVYPEEEDDGDSDSESTPPPPPPNAPKQPRGFIFGIDPSRIGITPDMQMGFGKEKQSILEKYAVNLTKLAAEGLLDPVIGREEEITRTIEILNRRSKNNPVLIGEPGVGKTAVAEGVAQRIVEGKVPEKLFDVELYQLDLTSLISGTQYRGQFEARMEKLVKECAANPNIVLVMDEIHTLASLGASEGSPGAGNILKPALSRGDVQIIGTTTADEYRQHIEKDAALERRFQPVLVDEATREQTLEILKGIAHLYSDYHNITITDEALNAAVDLSQKYISDRFQPDNAIDVLDEAAASVNANDPNLDEIRSLYKEDDDLSEKIKSMEDDSGNIKSDDLYEEHAHIISRRCRISESIKNYHNQQRATVLTVDDIAEVISRRTGIPAKSISESDREKLLNLEARLHERIIGQDEAVSGVAQAIRRRRAFKMSAKRPASFIFVGPTGVGKTELVKALAEKLFDDESLFIRLDMSEYMEKEAVSKLIGAPPGYIGYEEGGQLTEKVRLKPYSVILLDEIEKAHPDVFNILLQLLDDGILTDSQGKVVNFENTVIIMTSNAGTKSSAMGFGELKNGKISTNVDSALKEIFRPEFLNRVDKIVEFKSLTTDELLQIADLMLEDIRDELNALGAKFEITEDGRRAIVNEGYVYKYGARPMRRTIQDRIENPTAELIIRGSIVSGSTVVTDTDSEGNIKVYVK